MYIWMTDEFGLSMCNVITQIILWFHLFRLNSIRLMISLFGHCETENWSEPKTTTKKPIENMNKVDV